MSNAEAAVANLYVTSLFQFSDWAPSLSLNTGTNDSQGAVRHFECVLGEVSAVTHWPLYAVI